MKKIIITLILGLITVVSFSSCGNSKEKAKKFIVGEWILEGDNLGHHPMNDESVHIFFNADGTLHSVYILGDDTTTNNANYYIVNKNTIAASLDGEPQRDLHFEAIDDNELHLQDDDMLKTVYFFKRANNGK